MSTARPSSSSDLRQNGRRDNDPMSIMGAGAVTGYGWGRKQIWDGFLLGESAVKPTPELAGFLDSPPYLAIITGVRRHPGRAEPLQPGHALLGPRGDHRRSRTGVDPGPVVGVVHCLALGDVETFRDYYRREGNFAGPRRKLRSGCK